MNNKPNFYLYPGLQAHAQVQIRRKFSWSDPQITPEDIISIVCDVFEVSREDIISLTRIHLVHRARTAAQALMKHFTSLTYAEISRAVGRTDHSTAFHNIHQSKNWLVSYAEYKTYYDTAYDYCCSKQNKYEQAAQNVQISI
jgi:chromosomal replication initiation ATPase DnaA